MVESKRQELKDKVQAGVKRNDDRGRTTIVDRMGERAIEAKDKFAGFARAHPITTVAGALALGVLVSGMARRSPTRKLGKQASKLAGVGAEMAMAYAAQALAMAEEAGKPVGSSLGELGGTLSELGGTALGYGKSGSEAATKAARDAGKRIAKAIHGRLN